MPVDIAAFRKLISNRVTPKTCVTRVTCVTASNHNDLAGHEARAECVTCVTEPAVGSRSHALRDDGAQDCVTGKDDYNQQLARPGHAVTRSRTEIRGEKKNDSVVSATAVCDPEDWFAHFEERAAIREYEGGFDRTEAERLALDETIAALGPHPSTIH